MENTIVEQSKVRNRPIKITDIAISKVPRTQLFGLQIAKMRSYRNIIKCFYKMPESFVSDTDGMIWNVLLCLAS